LNRPAPKERQQRSAATAVARGQQRARALGRREGRAQAGIDAREAERERLRLWRLYEISKLLTGFESVEKTVPRVLAIVSGAVPLDVAVLVVEEPGAPTRAVVWHAEGVGKRQLGAAEAQATAGYGYLVRPPERGAPQPAREESGVRLPATPPIERAADALPGHYVLLPLVVGRGRIFGVLDLVGAARLDETDLMFVNVVANQLAVVLDRIGQARRVLQARQDFLAIVSHDLRNPLGTIQVNAALLLKTGELGPRERATIERMGRSGARMNRLLADLLDVGSLEAGHLAVDRKRTEVAPLVDEAVQTGEVVASQKGLQLERELLSDPGLVIECDRDRILQVFGNLISNATKFTPRGGTIKVRAEPHGDEVLFSVADTGPGVNAEELSHVFDRYWQAKGTARLGHGLGLTIAKGLVEAHGGHIWAESRVGKGATFFFTLPA
jgi:signal transduction histidine kinase